MNELSKLIDMRIRLQMKRYYFPDIGLGAAVMDTLERRSSVSSLEYQPEMVV